MSLKYLKNIFTKILLVFMALSIVCGNASILGLGIQKVIAEDRQVPNIEINLENSKYIQYQSQEYTGVALQTKISISPSQEEEDYLQAKKIEMQITLPKINNILPERASVVLADTIATTGQKNNQDVNQDYNVSSGVLNVQYENGNTTVYKENAQDEFEIIYIYPSGAYIGNNEELQLSYNIKTKIIFEVEDVELISQSTKIINKIQKDNVGELTSFSTTELKNDFYKGFMYSNVENHTNYNTEFKTVTTLCVLNRDYGNELILENNESKFVLGDEKNTIFSNGDIVYKKITIDRNEFDRILGEDGYIIIAQEENPIAMVTYDDDTTKLAIIYADGRDAELIDESIDSITIDFATYLNSFEIVTSKPIKEGFMHFENECIVKSSENYGYDVEKIKMIKLNTEVSGNLFDRFFILNEPNTNVNITLSNSNFSTLQSGKTTVTIKLDDTNSSCKLFNNPTLKIKLPEGIEKADISNPEIVNGNGLSINKTNIDKNVITIELTGKQTAYDITNVSGGISIVMDIDNIKYNELLSTSVDNVELTCIQNGENTVVNEKVNINSKNGILIVNKLENYSNTDEKLISFGEENNTVEIKTKQEAKVATNTVNIINNLNEDISSVEIIGRINSSFGSKLENAITANGQIFYSNNVDAKSDDEGWVKEFSQDAKAYKILLNNKINKQDRFEIISKIKIPNNLDYNKETYIKTEIKYTYNGQIYQDKSSICIKTEVDEVLKDIQEKVPEIENPKLEVSLGTNKDYLQGARFYSGSILYMILKINNISGEVLNNVNVSYTLPNELQYLEGGIANYDQFNGYTIAKTAGVLKNGVYEYTIDKLNAGENIEIAIYVRVKNLENISRLTIENIAKVSLNESEIYKTNIKNLEICQPTFDITLTSDVKQQEVKEGDIINFIINVNNTSDVQGGVSIIDDIPEQLEVLNIKYEKNGEEVLNSKTSKTNIEISEISLPNEKVKITITTQVKTLLEIEDNNYEIINKAVVINGITEKTSDEIKFTIKNTNVVQEDPNNSEKIGEVPAEKILGEDKKEEIIDKQEKTTSKYLISGVAWIDENKNGQRDQNEKLQDSVIVTLFNLTTGDIALDESGNKITAITDNEGKYLFNNIEEGEYSVLFEFDNNTFTVTTYQKDGVDEKVNSDAISASVLLDENEKLLAITDSIILSSNKENIDLGLIENAIFDLSLDKRITNIRVMNSKGTESYDYDEGDTAKVDLVAKYMAGSEVIVTYNFKITNNGDVTGYVDSLVDNLPSGLEFSSEVNPKWYQGSDGKLYSNSLSKILLKPGECEEIELVLTKTMTEDNAGTFVNNASLNKISNLENIQEKTDVLENNNSSAILIISIKTGSVMLYAGITLVCISIIALGTYVIKKKILNGVI